MYMPLRNKEIKPSLESLESMEEILPVEVPEENFEIEKSVEQTIEKQLKESKEPVKPQASNVSAIPISPLPPIKDELTKNVEKILEEDLSDTYFKMTPDVKKQFKEQGEKTALRIRELLDMTKYIAYEVVKLITDWLKIIPGVNKYFIEQEAKIKTDKILRLR
jgi:citrate lyase gamma subunit